jgi:hypothetical protein
MIEVTKRRVTGFRQKSKIWETIERKWIEALFLRKEQHEALGN